MNSTTFEVPRRKYIGGSDARIIMGNDEAALLRLWREKRGEAGRKTFRATLSSSSAWLPKRLTGIGTSATPARWSRRSSGGSSTR